MHSNKYSLSPQTLLWLRRVAMVTETVWMYQDKHMLSHSIICLKQHPGKKRKKEEKTPPQLAGSGKIYTTHFFFSSFLCVHTIQSFRIHKTDSKHYMHDNIHTGHKNCTQVIFFDFLNCQHLSWIFSTLLRHRCFFKVIEACASVKLSRAYPVNVWKASDKQHCRESATVNCLHLV